VLLLSLLLLLCHNLLCCFLPCSYCNNHGAVGDRCYPETAGFLVLAKCLRTRTCIARVCGAYRLTTPPSPCVHACVLRTHVYDTPLPPFVYTRSWHAVFVPPFVHTCVWLASLVPPFNTRFARAPRSPNVLIRMLNACIKQPHSHLAVFVMKADVDARLDFIQNMEYKFVELMSCHFIRSPEEIVQHQITYRYNAMKTRVGLMENRLRDVNNLVKLKNPSLLMQLQKAPPGQMSQLTR